MLQGTKLSYKLILVGSFTSYKAYTSCEFFSHELANRFKKLKHVDLQTCDFFSDGSNIKETDIILFHAYPDTIAVKKVCKFRQKAKKVVFFFEEKNHDFDFCYFYSDVEKDLMSQNSRFIKLPTVKAYYECTEKESGSILLDHKYYQNVGDDNWVDRLMDFFDVNKDVYPNVYQLDRPQFKIKRPSHIKLVKHDDPQDYLKNTAKFERFICTHPGSYNHTVVDMALRGTEIFSPTTKQFEWWVPRCNVEFLKIQLFKNEKELHELLQKPPINEPKINLATDLDDVVSMMDTDFRHWSSAKKIKKKIFI